MRQGGTLRRPGTTRSYGILRHSCITLVHPLKTALLALGLVLAMNGSTTAAEVPRVRGELTIFTAASLTDAFKDIAAQIEQANPGTKLTFNFASSPTLRTQLAQGARADVFASADEPNMAGAEKDGTIIGEPQIFARNQLVVVVPAQNPAGIHTLQDLTKPKLKLVLTNKDVPVGNYARQALEKLSQDATYLDEIARRANATNFGLGSGVWTRDVSKAHRLAKAIRAGSVWVNCYQAMDPAVPFGGYKMSGYGRESGLQQFDEYLNVKAVWIKTA
jgi:ABC-type molybdate transport system substrate-binding protein